MEKFIPYEKLSKKKQRELNAARRTTWSMNPVTRKPANPKAYNRKTARNWKDDSNSVPFDSVFVLLKPKKSKNALSYPIVAFSRHTSPCIGIIGAEQYYSTSLK